MKVRVSLALLLLAAVISLGFAQKCGLITMTSELGSVDMPSDEGVIADALNLGGDNPVNPRIQLVNFQVTCAVADTEPETFQFLSVVVAISCVDDPLSPLCGASELGGEGDFTVQFELACDDGEWVLGDGAAATLSVAFTNPANGSLTTPTDLGCGVCFSNTQAAARLPGTVSYNSINHCASCATSCLNAGLGLCTELGDAACCPFYHDAGSGFMCVDMCPMGFSPNATFFCALTCPDLDDPADGTLNYAPSDPPRFVGTVATYECEAKFALKGEASRTCQMDGEWSGTAPTCDMCPDGCSSCEYNEDGELVCLSCEDEDFEVGPDGKCAKPDVCPDGCSMCELNDAGELVCVECENEEFVVGADGKCAEPISGGGTCVGCIVGGILGAILGALLLAAIVAAIIGSLYYYKTHPNTMLKKGDAEGLNGVAKDNPLYVDPEVVETEVEGQQILASVDASAAEGADL